MWVGVAVVVVSLIYLWSSWYPRIACLIDRHPVVAVALAVPGTLVAIASMGAHPFVVLALLVVFGAALVVMELHNSGQSAQRMRLTAVAEKRNHQRGAGHARSPGDQARAAAPQNAPSVVAAAPPPMELTKPLVSDQGDAGTNIIRLRLEFEAEAKAAEALAAQAEALAEEARARGIQLRLEAEASAEPVALPDYHRA